MTKLCIPYIVCLVVYRCEGTSHGRALGQLRSNIYIAPQNTVLLIVISEFDTTFNWHKNTTALSIYCFSIKIQSNGFRRRQLQSAKQIKLFCLTSKERGIPYSALPRSQQAN